MMQLSDPISIIKYSEKNDNRDTFLLQKSTIEPEASFHGGEGGGGGKITIHNKAALLMFEDDENHPEVVTTEAPRKKDAASRPIVNLIQPKVGGERVTGGGILKNKAPLPPPS